MLAKTKEKDDIDQLLDQIDFHGMTALGCKAYVSGFTAYYISCHDLVEVLIKAKEQNRLTRKLKWFAKPNLLLVDEVGYEPLAAEQTHALFQRINVRYETGAMITTSNKTFKKMDRIHEQ